MIFIGLFFFLLMGCEGETIEDRSSGPDWEKIKNQAMPFVALPDEFDTPYKMPLAVGGWEDGLYITRDGLDLYCIYFPVDLFSFYFLGEADISNFSAYRRGPTFGMDLKTNPAGAAEWLHGDILHSHRDSVKEPFTRWQLSNLARPVWSEGAVQIVSSDPSTADIFAYTSNHNSSGEVDNVDILVFRNCSRDPSGIGTPLPAPVTTAEYEEDNPHFERLDSRNLLLFYESNRPGGAGSLDIWYSTSTDDGVSWSTPRPVTTINTKQEQQMPHLFRADEGTWYLYYANENPATGKLEIWRARLSEPGNWDSWTDKQLVIGVGNTFAVGEPTLTRNGDIVFIVVYDAGSSATRTDRFDADPWFLPRKR